MGLSLLNKIKEELKDVANVEQEPSLEGGNYYGFVASKEKKLSTAFDKY